MELQHQDRRKMPSKEKKISKSKAKALNQSTSSRTPSSGPLLPSLVMSEEELRKCIDEASVKFPSLIGKSSLVGEITCVDSEAKGCRIWLSESSMVAASLAPGSLVSVSLASSRERLSSGLPLKSFTDECAKHLMADSVNKVANLAGNYFALATVFPSTKVLKNEVRLSSNLCCTMGYPVSGRIVFIFPILHHPLGASENVNNNASSTAGSGLPLVSCRELFLEMAFSTSNVGTSDELSILNSSEDSTSSQMENGIVSSPKTPMHRSKLRSPLTDQFSSPLPEDSVPSIKNFKSKASYSFVIQEVLRDEAARKLLEKCATSWLYFRSLLCGNLVCIPVLSELCCFHVIGTSCDQTLESVSHVNSSFFVDLETKVRLLLPSSLTTEVPQVRGSSVSELGCKIEVDIKLGGLSKEYAILKDIIISSSVKNTLTSLGLRTTKGVLLHGPPGTGKTSLAQLCARDAGVNFFPVNGPEIVSQYYGESEKALLEVFDSACHALPAVVFIDELDSIAPARKDGGEELSQRMVATLLNLMDGISRNDGLLVIAATSRPGTIEPALRRPGRLDREIEIGVPSPKQRLDILINLLSGMEHSLSDVQVQQLATVTHGFVGADLAALCNEAALVCLRHYVQYKKPRCNLYLCTPSNSNGACLDNIITSTEFSRDSSDVYAEDIMDSVSSSDSDHVSSAEILKSISSRDILAEGAENNQNDIVTSNERTLGEEVSLKSSFEDFEKARLRVRPSAMREVILEVPKVNWEDVGGQKEVKMQLMEAVEWPQKYQDAFKRIGTHPPTGILLFGPPGCSKTLLARAVASEAGLNFLAVKGPELFSKWVGESEKAVRSLFAKARANAPAIIFFDEIDGLAVIRGKESDGVSVADRVMSQLLVELDGLHQRVNVTVIAATNRPDKIDLALLRPGRFDRLVYVGPPNHFDREEIFCIHLRKTPCAGDVSSGELASLTEGYTGADISLICREAAVAALEENLEASTISMEHFRTAIRQVKPSNIESYQHLSTKFQRLVHSNARSEMTEHQFHTNPSRWRSIINFPGRFFHKILAVLLGSKPS